MEHVVLFAHLSTRELDLQVSPLTVLLLSRLQPLKLRGPGHVTCPLPSSVDRRQMQSVMFLAGSLLGQCQPGDGAV